MELENKLNLIKLRVEQLVSRNVQLINENVVLADEIKKLKSENEYNKKNIQELENKTVNSHFSKSIENEDKNRLKSVIEDLINEIDKGIELLKS